MEAGKPIRLLQIIWAIDDDGDLGVRVVEAARNGHLHINISCKLAKQYILKLGCGL